MQTESLKPCPFCGGEATLVEDDGYGNGYAICYGCEGFGDVFFAWDDDGKPADRRAAIERWNTRAGVSSE